tara:strand:+ start:651 stop:1028 length:378 start_codon:yes stop_codon:yes gene_type:complete
MPKILFKKKINGQYIQVFDDGSVMKYKLDKKNNYDSTIRISDKNDVYKVKWNGNLENGKGVFLINDNRIYFGEIENNSVKQYEYIKNNEYLFVKKEGKNFIKKFFTLNWNKTNLDLLSDIASKSD